MRIIHRGIALLLCIMLVAILSLVLFEYEETAFWCKRVCSAPQGVLLLCGLAVMTVLCGVAKKIRKHQRMKTPGWLALLPWAGLLGLELVLCFHTYFITGWDVRGVIDTAYAIAGGEADMHHAYLSQYPNNISIVMLFAAILRVVRLVLGNPGMDRCIFVLIAFQCVINTCTGMLCKLSVFRMTGSKRLSWCAALVYMAFIGISPWLMIPYSDSVALFFPTAIVALYAYRDDERIKKWVWPLIGILAGLGYMIKPQVLIAAIAIAIVESARLLLEGKILIWVRRIGVMALVLVLFAAPGMQLLIQASPIEMRPGRSMNMLHYVMMGLNQETNGSYLYDDVVLTYHAQDKHAEQLPVIKSRLEELGVKGLAEHLKKKTLTNYADGTFAWACEGEFYKEWIADKDEVLSPFLKSLVYTGSSRYVVLQTVFQIIWLALLAGTLLCSLRAGGVAQGERERDLLSVMMLCLIGITMFQTIFEARARYLYLYSPFYVILGVSGIWRMICTIKKCFTAKG